MRIARVRFFLIIAVLYGFATIAQAGAQQAPPFSLPGDGGTINLSDYRGKVVYLDFWASWCDPCMRSFPWMNALQQQYGQDGFAVIAINLDASRADADSFLARMPASFRIAYDHDGGTAEAYNLKAMPGSYIIDQRGNLVHHVVGYRSGEKMIIERKIRELIGQDALASR